MGTDAASHVGVRSTLYAALLCSNTRLEQETTEDGVERWVPRGNSSEAPIVVAAAKVGIQAGDVAAQHTRVLEIPFSSARKMMLAVSKVDGHSKLGDAGMALPEGCESSPQ